MGNQQINKFKWSLFAVSLLLGAMLTIQITSGKNQNYNFRADIITINSSFAYEAKHRQQLLESINDMQQKIDSYQNPNANQENVLEKMKDDLDKAKIEGGLTPLKGDGIRIRIKENSSFSAVVPDRAYSHPEQYHLWDWELQYLINILHSNGAQALAFNGQRIVTTTGIREVGVTSQDGVVYPGVMQVNLSPVRMPFVIEAIGDIDRMKGTISTYIGNDYFILKGLEMDVTEVKGDTKLSLQPYSGKLHFQFATEDMEGETKP
jgi:uncharacterized protein YlxW (UPF0749 family)